jgi:hypothetical protein
MNGFGASSLQVWVDREGGTLRCRLRSIWMSAFTFLRDPMFLIGVPVLTVGLFYELAVCTALGMSLVACALIPA